MKLPTEPADDDLVQSIYGIVDLCMAAESWKHFLHPLTPGSNQIYRESKRIVKGRYWQGL